MGKKNTEETLADETDKLVDRILNGEVDGIIGGFPCQDISIAGKGAGLSGERSGLWREMLRTIRLVRPLYVLVENVAALLSRGMGVVLADLAESGYDTEWGCISAAGVGAPHLRERIYIIAHARRERGERFFPKQIQRQPEFSWCENVRGAEDFFGRPDIPEPLLWRNGNGAAKRLHGIGNCNPPCVIRELTKGLK